MDPERQLRGDYFIGVAEKKVVAVGQPAVAAEVRVAVLPDQVALPIDLPDSVRTGRVGRRTTVSKQQVSVGQEKSIVDAAIEMPPVGEITLYINEIGVGASVGGKQGVASKGIGRLVFG